MCIRDRHLPIPFEDGYTFSGLHDCSPNRTCADIETDVDRHYSPPLPGSVPACCNCPQSHAPNYIDVIWSLPTGGRASKQGASVPSSQFPVRSPAVGCQPLAVGCQPLAVGCWPV